MWKRNSLKTTSDSLLSSIDTMVVGIGHYNYASKAVAKKLGFDENGFLRKEDYFQQKEETMKK